MSGRYETRNYPDCSLLICCLWSTTIYCLPVIDYWLLISLKSEPKVISTEPVTSIVSYCMPVRSTRWLPHMRKLGGVVSVVCAARYKNPLSVTLIPIINATRHPSQHISQSSLQQPTFFWLSTNIMRFTSFFIAVLPFVGSAFAAPLSNKASEALVVRSESLAPRTVDYVGILTTLDNDIVSYLSFPLTSPGLTWLDRKTPARSQGTPLRVRWLQRSLPLRRHSTLRNRLSTLSPLSGTSTWALLRKSFIIV